eukprot:scaffold11964_cov38-Tisochrysis_lutea.AAC.2
MARRIIVGHSSEELCARECGCTHAGQGKGRGRDACTAHASTKQRVARDPHHGAALRMHSLFRATPAKSVPRTSQCETQASKESVSNTVTDSSRSRSTCRLRQQPSSVARGCRTAHSYSRLSSGGGYSKAGRTGAYGGSVNWRAGWPTAGSCCARASVSVPAMAPAIDLAALPAAESAMAGGRGGRRADERRRRLAVSVLHSSQRPSLQSNGELIYTHF